MTQKKEQGLYQNIIWRSRRGMLELDLLLSPFVHNIFPQLEAKQQQAYALLLEQEDTDLYQWLALAQPAPQELVAIVARIRRNAEKPAS